MFSRSVAAASIRIEEWKQLPLRSAAQKDAGLFGGEGLQQIMDIAYAPSNPDIVFLVADQSQVWKSTDGGFNWKMSHKGFHANGGFSIAVDPHNENIVFAAGSIGHPVSDPNNHVGVTGIFRSVHGGDQWELVNEDVRYFGKPDGYKHQGRHFVFDPSSFDGERTRVVYAGTFKDGFFKSIEGGDTGSWNLLGLVGLRIYDVEINPQNSSLIYIATNGGLYRYNNSDGLLSKIGAGLPDSNNLDYPRTIAVNHNNPNIIYAAAGFKGIYISIDGGENFLSRNGVRSEHTLPIAPHAGEYVFISSSPVNPDYLYASGHITGGREHKNCDHINGIEPYWSHDGGLTWYPPDSLDKDKTGFGHFGRMNADKKWIVGHIEPHPQNANVALMAANGGARVLKTDDGGITWSYSNNGFTGGRVGVGKTSFSFSENPLKMILGLADHGPVLTEDGGDTFRILRVPPTIKYGTSNKLGKTTPVVAISPNGNLMVIAFGGYHEQLLAISEDNGNRWEVLGDDPGEPDTSDKYRFIAFHPQNPSIIYAQGWKSIDKGKSWYQLSKKIRAVYPGNGDIVYALEDSSPGKYAETIVYKSIDGGESWTTPYELLPVPRAKFVSEINIDPTNPDRIYVAGLYILDPSTLTWSKRDERHGLAKDRFGKVTVKNVVVDPQHPEIIYAGKWAPGRGHSNGIFRSKDYGETWENITYNLGPEFTSWALSINPHNGYVYLGSSHGTWILPPPIPYQKP